jgi:hypothetical protein
MNVSIQLSSAKLGEDKQLWTLSGTFLSEIIRRLLATELSLHVEGRHTNPKILPPRWNKWRGVDYS